MKRYGNVFVNYKEKKKIIKVRKLSFLGMIRGLMFRKKNFPDILYFDFSNTKSNAIHSFFVFFDFYALWLDDKNNVIEINRIKPFVYYFKPNLPSIKLIEIPVNDKNTALIDFFVGKRKV